MKKEEIKTQLKIEMNKKIDEFVDSRSNELTKEEFNMSNVEETIGKTLNDYQTKIIDTTEKMFNSKSEAELISKKKQSMLRFF